jgi:hypothetical protein
VYEWGENAAGSQTIGPGQTVLLGPGTSRSELKTKFTGIRLKAENVQLNFNPYDKTNTDIASILKMMMFYDAIEGGEYTRLANGYQSFVDMSDLLKAGRAILIAEAADASQDTQHGAELIHHDGASTKKFAGSLDKHNTFFRFVLPVKPGK